MITASEIGAHLGLDKLRRSWRGTCPVCDYARAFSTRQVAGRPVVYCANGCTQSVLSDALARVFREDWRPAADAKPADPVAREGKIAAALKVWHGATSITGTPAETYLASRGLAHLAASAALRFRADTRHPEDRALHPALVALVSGPDGAPVAVHRTYLTRDGRKANVEPVKASKGPLWGGAIRLDPVAPELVIGEGIESSAAAGLLLGLPAWAAVSAGNLARGLLLPVGVRAVVIAADADKAGQEAAEAAAARWQAEGRHVRIAKPNRPGADFADLLAARAGVAHAA